MKTLLAVAIPLLLIGCEVNTTVSVDNNYPPTFTIHGSGGIYLLRVYDMTDPHSMDSEWWKRPGIWEIATPQGGEDISAIPPITYGVVPPGFVQKTPDGGKPPLLSEGRVYWVWTPSYGANGGGSYKFTVRDGRTVEIRE